MEDSFRLSGVASDANDISDFPSGSFSSSPQLSSLSFKGVDDGVIKSSSEAIDRSQRTTG